MADNLGVKPEINYVVRTRENPADRTKTVKVPEIVDRQATVPLEYVVASAIDRGLIAGLKPSAAKSVADALAESMYHQFSLGKGIAFGKFFYGRLYLEGLAGEDGSVSPSRNRVNVRLMKGEDFRLSMSDFEWHNVDESTPVRIFNIQTIGGRLTNTLIAEQPFAIYGMNLKCGVAGDSLVATWNDGTARTLTLTIGENDSGHIDVAWDEGFGEIAPNTEITFTLTNHPDGADAAPVVTTHRAVVVSA